MAVTATTRARSTIIAPPDRIVYVFSWRRLGGVGRAGAGWLAYRFDFYLAAQFLNNTLQLP